VISIPNLIQISDALKEYRGDGYGDVLFDGRDRGNYSAYHWDSTIEMLQGADPTGLSIGMLLNEMIEATIDGSQVKLSKVLREAGFIERVSKILKLKANLTNEIEGPMSSLIEKVNQALSATSSEFGVASSREVAICLRDAIYCMERGLKMHWLVCDVDGVIGASRLCNTIDRYETVADFADALRSELGWGSHIARIGKMQTAIGLKHPGRIALMSSLQINLHSGEMHEDRATNSHMAESLDLDTAVERYPNWLNPDGKARSSYNSSEMQKYSDEHVLNSLQKLPRDVLIWFAMLVEIAGQRMGEVDTSNVALAENLVRALPMQEKKHEGEETKNLPMVILPNWTADALSFDSSLKSLLLADWELGLFERALEGLDIEMFLPLEQDMMFDVCTKAYTAYVEPKFSDHEWHQTHAGITAMSDGCFGTREEINLARKAILNRNLMKYLMDWGNWKMGRLWDESKAWFRERLLANIEAAMLHPCATAQGEKFVAYRGVHIYAQSAKHKTYNPRCYFNPKKVVTHAIEFAPKTDSDLAEILGLGSTKELPKLLQGWRRHQGWTTTDRFDDRTKHPVDMNARWLFADKKNDFLVGSMCVNAESLGAAVKEKLGIE
jgi:hypothetical protein